MVHGTFGVWSCQSLILFYVIEVGGFPCKENSNMAIKGAAIHFRLTDAEEAAVREFMRRNATSAFPPEDVDSEP